MPARLRIGLDDVDDRTRQLQTFHTVSVVRGLQNWNQALNLVDPAVRLGLFIVGSIGRSGDDAHRLERIGAILDVEVTVLAFDLGEVDTPGVLGAG